MLDFRLQPGEALGVIGVSASGKSTLARVLTGIWRPASGAVRLDGAALDHYEPDVLGSYIGYLPQDVVLFDGTVAENIGRMQAQPDAGGGGGRGEEGRRARDDPRRCRRATTRRSRPAARGSRAGRSSASGSPAPSTATRCCWCSTSRTRTSTPPARTR